jgi:hypothetical protein
VFVKDGHCLKIGFPASVQQDQRYVLAFCKLVHSRVSGGRLARVARCFEEYCEPLFLLEEDLVDYVA